MTKFLAKKFRAQTIGGGPRPPSHPAYATACDLTCVSQNSNFVSVAYILYRPKCRRIDSAYRRRHIHGLINLADRRYRAFSVVLG